MSVWRHSARRRTAGFTLLELLVAVAITAVLVGFMIAIVSNVSGFWARSSGRLAAEAQARYVLDQLTLDLQSAGFRDSGEVALAVDVLTDTATSGAWETRRTSMSKPASAAGSGLRYDAPEISRGTFGQAGVWLRLFTAKRGSNRSLETLSAPVAAAWQIVRRSANGHIELGDVRYFLHRSEMPAADTLAAGFDLAAERYSSPGSALRSPPVGSIVADNVIDFGVRFHAPDASGKLVRIFPAADETSHRATNPPGVGDRTMQFPTVADLMLRVLTEEGARRIAAFEADPPRLVRPPDYATDAEFWWAIALAHSHVFTRRIALPGRERMP